MAPRTTLTTGANSGIGLATVLELARRGFRSVGTVRSPAKADTVVAAAEAAGVHVETAILDVTDPLGCAEMIDAYRPYAMINNAGYAGTGAVEDVDDEEVRAQLEAMVVGPMRLARLALPYQRAAGGGRIVNVSSIYGLTTTPLSGWYQASKHAPGGRVGRAPHGGGPRWHQGRARRAGRLPYWNMGRTGATSNGTPARPTVARTAVCCR